MFAVLKNRDYFWLWLGQTISLLGDSLRDFAMMFWIFRASGDDPLMLSLSLIASASPSLILSPVAGVWVDRWDRRRTMIISDIVRGCLSLVLVAVVISGHYGLALGVTFLASCAAQFFGPSRSAMIRKIVGPEQLLQANSLGSTTNSIMALAAPAAATSIFVLLGPTVSFSLDAATFFLSAVCIGMVGISGKAEAKPSATPQFWAELKEGLRFGLGLRPLRTIMIAMTMVMMGAGAMNAVGLLIIKHSLGVSETTFGYLSPLQTFFSLLAAVLVGTAAKKLKRVHLLVPVGLAFATASMTLFAAAQNIWWLVLALPLMGVANVVLNLGSATTTQRLVPDHLMGRVNAVMGMPIVTAMLLSAGAAGVVARYAEPRLIMVAAAALIGLGTVSAYLGLRDVPAIEIPRAEAPAASAS